MTIIDRLNEVNTNNNNNNANYAFLREIHKKSCPNLLFSFLSEGILRLTLCCPHQHSSPRSQCTADTVGRNTAVGTLIDW